VKGKPHYLLVLRGKEPNKGKWSFPGGKLEMGETALEGGSRELFEETRFTEQKQLKWFKETIMTADSIIKNEDGSTSFHFLIAICFAALDVEKLPEVSAADDAADAKWWSIQGLILSDEPYTEGLVDLMRRTEFLYKKGAI
jgi:8-oxo-dGTP diphosphatase